MRSGAPHWQIWRHDITRTLRTMTTFVFRLKAPRPNFALDMTDDEREIMGRHAAHWQSYIDSGQMVVFGPVLDDTGSWGLGVVEADDEDEVRAFAVRDPVVISGTADIEIGKMLAGFVRPRDLRPASYRSASDLRARAARERAPCARRVTRVNLRAFAARSVSDEWSNGVGTSVLRSTSGVRSPCSPFGSDAEFEPGLDPLEFEPSAPSVRTRGSGLMNGIAGGRKLVAVVVVALSGSGFWSRHRLRPVRLRPGGVWARPT